MSSASKEPTLLPAKPRSIRRRNVAIFVTLLTVWLLFDVLSKQYFTQAFAAGTVSEESILGLFQFTLVHNSGAAWGIFGDSTKILAVISLVVSALILVYFIFVSARANIAEVVGLALIISGGIGNAIDRFISGYVVDFIEFSFMYFPVFNIADMGVTCGFVILLAGIIYSWFRENQVQKSKEPFIDDVGI